jgi:hypothetical protein
MKKLLVTASILMASMSSFAAFTAGMNAAQVETEARAQAANGVSSAAILAAAQAQGLSVPAVAAALISSGRDASAVTTAAVTLAPNQAQAIVTAAATAAPAQAQGILNAAVVVVGTSQSNALQTAVLSVPTVAPGSVTAPTAAGPQQQQVAQASVFNGAPAPRSTSNGSTGSGNSTSRR